MPVPVTFNAPVPPIALVAVKLPARLKFKTALLRMIPEPSVPVEAPVPTWTIPAAMVSWPVKALLPSSTKVPAVVFVVIDVPKLPPLISVTFCSVPASSCRIIGRPDEPMVKPLRSSEAAPLRRSVEVTAAKPAPIPRVMELRTFTDPPVIESKPIAVPLGLVELPRETGPLMVTEPPVILTVPCAVCEEANVELLSASFRPSAPMMTVPPEIFSVPAETPVAVPTVFRRSPILTDDTSKMPAEKFTVPVTEAPSLLIRPPILRVESKRSTVWPDKSARTVGVAPVLSFIQPTFMTARPVPARLRITKLPVVSRKFSVAPPRLPPRSTVLTLKVLTAVPMRNVCEVLAGESMLNVAATIVEVGAKVTNEPEPPATPPSALVASPTRKVPPAKPA